jgi:hypothetical protein
MVGKTADCLKVIKQKKKVIYINSYKYSENKELIQSLTAYLYKRKLLEYWLSSMPEKQKRFGKLHQ